MLHEIVAWNAKGLCVCYFLFIDNKENRANVHPTGNLSHFMSTGKEALSLALRILFWILRFY